MTNYYSILGLTESASQEDIRAAFKQLALKYHPDKHQGDPLMEERFKEVNEAYQILSNPYEKARFDIKLKYGQRTQPEYSSYSPPPPPRPTYKRPNYKEPEIDWKENWKATAYAFGFTFIMAAVVMSGIGIKEYFDARALEKLLTERRLRFEHARSEYKLGNIDIAAEEINALGAFLKTEEDMEQYKNQLYNSFVFEGEHHYNQGKFKDAIFYYELVAAYGNREPLPLKEHLALAYKKTKQPKKSLEKFEEVLTSGYRSIEAYIQMAEIYRDMLNDNEEAKHHYELASNLAIKKYKSIYGEAYPLILTAKVLPEEHYHLYVGLADIYQKTGEPERAIKATRWNINIWPDSLANYVIAARSYEDLGRPRKACQNYRAARRLGYADIPDSCR